MSEPQNLNQSSPGALNTGAPPRAQVALNQPVVGAAAPTPNILPPQGGGTVVGGGGGGSGETLAPTQVADFNAAVSTIYPCDPGAGNINATLPSAAASGTKGGQTTPIEIYNNSIGVGTVTILPSGADTVAGGFVVPYVIQAQQVVRLISDGVSNWMTAP